MAVLTVRFMRCKMDKFKPIVRTMKENTVSLSISDPRLIKKLPTAQSGKTIDIHVKCHVQDSGDRMETDYSAMDAKPMSKGAKAVVGETPKYRCVRLSGNVLSIGSPSQSSKSEAKMSPAAKASLGK